MSIIGGMVPAWWRELPGGLVSLAGMVAMVLFWHVTKGGFPPAMALVFTLPMWLFLLSAWVNGPASIRTQTN